MIETPEDATGRADEPAPDPKSAHYWWSQIVEAEKAFDAYQHKADNIDKMYADLDRLSKLARDREFQLFWANIQVLAPSIYARPPVPVVVPKFKDRRPLFRVASELLERCTNTAFDLADINSVMMLLRDDLAVVGRGVAWVRYETKGESETESERICVDFKDRKDFLHEPARYWPEVGWVAGAGYLTLGEMRKRFRKSSGDAYQRATYNVRKEDKDNGAADNRKKAKVWEIWSKTENRVVWVTEGVDVLLDEGEPHLKLEGFFPCPRPAYGTVQRRSLIPVPDLLYYKDQIEEINELTGRIHALSEALVVRGFYPAGAGEIGDAIETALKMVDNRQVMVPVSNWAAFGTGGAKDTIVWLPIDVIAATVQGLVELRRQIIDDVYQIMGLSDIMRGSTEKEETATAQQIKAQFGSVRIRDKQAELVRIARDIVRIAAEIMAENFSQQTLLEMSQMQIPTEADIKRQVDGIMQQAEQAFQQQVQQALQNPEIAQQAQANPEQAQQMAAQLQQQIVAQAQAEIQKVQETQPTIEAVMKFLRDQRIRPFVLDIETDSTIQPDEDAEKQRRAEFLTALGGTMQQLAGLVQLEPSAAGFAAEVLKFAVAPFRAGRDLEGAIDEFAEQMKQRASNPPPNPEAAAAQADMQMKMQELQAKLQIEREKIEADREDREIEREAKREEQQAKMVQIQAEQQRDREKHGMEMEKLRMELQAMQAKIGMQHQQAEIQAATMQQKAAIEADSAERKAAIQERQAEQAAVHSEQAFQQKSALTEQQAASRAGDQ